MLLMSSFLVVDAKGEKF
jgi:hypothetical protein